MCQSLIFGRFRSGVPIPGHWMACERSEAPNVQPTTDFPDRTLWAILAWEAILQVYIR